MLFRLLPSANFVYRPKDFSPFSKSLKDLVSPFEIAKREAALCLKLPIYDVDDNIHRSVKAQITAYSFLALQYFRKLFRFLLPESERLGAHPIHRKALRCLRRHLLEETFVKEYRLPPYYVYVGRKYRGYLRTDYLGFTATFLNLLKKAEHLSPEEIDTLLVKTKFAFFSLPWQEHYTPYCGRRFQLFLDTEENVLCFIVKCFHLTENDDIVLEPRVLFYRVDENTSSLLQKSKLLFPPLCSPAALYLFVASEKGSGSDAGQTFSNTALEAT